MANKLFKLYLEKISYEGDNIGSEFAVTITSGTYPSRTIEPEVRVGRPAEELSELLVRDQSGAGNVALAVTVKVEEEDEVTDEGVSTKKLEINLNGANSQPFDMEVAVEGKGGDKGKTAKFKFKFVAEVVADPCSALFEEMDYETHPPDVMARIGGDLTADQANKRLETVVFILGKVIEKREAKRLKDAKGNKIPEEKSLRPCILRPANRARALADARTISGILLGLFKKHCPDGNKDIDFDKLWGCFEAFANGELRVADRPSSREPDRGTGGSPQPYFRFAEFALTCIELDIDKTAWFKLARIMIATQEIYLKAYPDRDPYKYQKTNQMDAAGKAALRKKYGAFTKLEELLEALKENVKKQ